MFNQLLAIIAPMIICTGVGVCWGKYGKEFPADFISRIVMNIGTPCLIVSVMAKVQVDALLMGDVALATAWVMCCMGVLGFVGLRVMTLPVGTYLPPLIFPNNGNMGLPLCLFAFGPLGLALALGSFMVMMIGTFTLFWRFILWLSCLCDDGFYWRHSQCSIAAVGHAGGGV
jgi:malate permease and related proteins